MIPKRCKRLAEVDFPIAAVSRLATEKSAPKGYPFMLHLWWARRPLGACRAMLLGLLWPEPSDPLCPESFKERARALLPAVQGEVGEGDLELRRALLKFIGDIANWDLSANPVYLDVARSLIAAAHGQQPPLVVDPFAGGGSIPLEALRLGCEAFATDLNPVAGLILKVGLDDIPRGAAELAHAIRRVGREIQQRATDELLEIYPRDPDGGAPIAYLWARTIRCEAPNCGAEIPLIRSFWLSKKANRRRAVRQRVVSVTGGPPEIEFDVFEPASERDVPSGNVTRARAKCPACQTVLPPERVRSQLFAQRGGTDAIFELSGKRTGGARLFAVAMTRSGEQGRHYRPPTERDYAAVFKAKQRLEAELKEWDATGRQNLCPVPDEPLPPIGTLGFRVQRYGMVEWGDLFTARQKVALTSLLRLIKAATADEMRRALSCAFSRVVMSAMSCTRWNAVAEKMQHTFGRQALPIVWDFAEIVPTADAPGNWKSGFELVADVAEAYPRMLPGQVQQADAAAHPLPDETASVWFTDPPYYDAVPYADLSDFFFAWLKRCLPDNTLRDPFDSTNPLTPKAQEIVQDDSKAVDGRPKDREFFERSMNRAFAEGRRVLREDGVASVVFAHKTTEGWEALLSGMIGGGWTITGSWPIATEMGSRLRARDSAALATSVHLVCRPRPDDAGIGDWADILRELPNRVGNWMERLQREGVRGADLVFACIGPALELFSRYGSVETPDGRVVALPEYLEKVWEVVGRSALAQVLGTAEARARNGVAGAVEEDARLTALFLWTLQSTNGSPAPGESDSGDDADSTDEDEDEDSSSRPVKGYTLAFDVVRRFAQPLGIELPVWEGRIVDTNKGVVRLLPVLERTKQLFGQDGAQTIAARLEHESTAAASLQQMLFPEMQSTFTPKIHPGGRGSTRSRRSGLSALATKPREATTLDRVHAAMLLQASGRTTALRALLKAEQERGSDFVRLANALSALYPRDSEEKRLLDAMLLAIPR